jgi:hypothetical protein
MNNSNVTFSCINGSEVRVGHCINRYNCNEPICVGTDCGGYKCTNPHVMAYTVVKGQYNYTKDKTQNRPYK